MTVIGRTESADFVHLGIEKDGKTTLSMTPSISKYPNKRLLAESFQKDVNASVHKFKTT